MIVRKPHNDHIHIYSDKGLKIKEKQTGRILTEVMEDKNCYFKYDYEEVEE